MKKDKFKPTRQALKEQREPVLDDGKKKDPEQEPVIPQSIQQQE